MSTITLLEDDDLSACIIEGFLQEQGFTLHKATSLQAMARLLEEQRPDLILSDIHLPDGNGIDFCPRWRSAKQYNCSLIAITASSKQDSISDAFTQGADDYIQKPLILPELLARIQLHLKNHQLQQAMTGLLDDQETGILIVNQQQDIIFANRYVRDLWQQSQLQIPLQQWLQQHPELQHYIASHLTTNSTAQALFTHVRLAKRTLYLKVQVTSSPLAKEHRIIYLHNQTELTELKQLLSQQSSPLLGNSPAIETLRRKISQVAGLSWTVLISGPSGSGKELVAREIHRQSPRTNAPFIAVNCAALSESLLMDQLFGHEKGAFTNASQSSKGVFEACQGGTLFLDEIGDLPLTMQGALLRVLQEKTITRIGSTRSVNVDTRLIFASHHDIAQLVNAGKFRQDLYYRISSALIRVPPLRERAQDIPLLLTHFQQELAQESGGSPVSLMPEAMNWLCLQTWPGNVRQLEQFCRRLLLDSISPAPLALCQQIYLIGSDGQAAAGLPISPSPDNAPQDQETQNALISCHGDKEAAARLLGISRATLYRRLQRLKNSHS